MSDRILALIPAFNEEPRLADVVRRTVPHVNEVIVVDDGSTDRTGEVARAGGATVLRHEINRGKGSSIVTALDYFRNSDAEFAILLDADGQHDPSEITEFIEAARSTGADVVVGTRLNNPQNMPWVRLQTNRFTSWMTAKLAGQRIPDSQCGYRLLRHAVLKDLKLMTTHFETETEMLIQVGRAGHKIVSIPIRTIYEGQVSHIHPLRDAVRFFKMVGRYLGR